MAKQDSPNKGWLDAVAEGGLPQLLAGPAGKAISRLVGAGVEIPAAWLEQRAQAIRDETEARSKMMQALAEKSAELGFANEELLNRGLNSLLGKAYREQENREAIARRTVELLSEKPPPVEASDPSDDWMNVFEEYAEKASSDELRELWSRILAGEIRHSQTFSLSTMNFLAILDHRRAEEIKSVVPHVVDGAWIPYERGHSSISVGEIYMLEDFGFGSRAGGVTWKLEPESHGKIVCRVGGVGFIIDSGGNTILIPAFILSSAGRELAPIFRIHPIRRRLSER